MGRDLRVARRRRQIVVAEQDLNDPDIGSVLQEMGREAVAQRMHRHAFGQTRCFRRRPASGVQDGRINRMTLVAAGKEIEPWPGPPPINAEDAEQLRRQHHVAVFRPLAVPDQDDAPRAVDVGDHETADFRGPQSGRIAASERRPALQARNGFKELHDFVRAQYHGQLAGLPRIRNALGNNRFSKRHAVKEPQRTDDLVQRRP